MKAPMCVACVFAIAFLPLVDSGAITHFQMISFTGNGRDSGGECCDGYLGICGSKCDLLFRFCFDVWNGDTDTTHCEYARFDTGEYSDTNSVTFDLNNMEGVANPIALRFDSWPGGVKLKVKVRDDDSGHSGHDNVDHIYKTWRVPPSRAFPTRTIYTKTLQGSRNSNPTHLVVNISSWCEANYYGNNCDVPCVGQDNQNGHYTCNPNTGAKICMAGWEDPSSDCTVFSDDCYEQPCQNGARCIDENRGYTCQCADGYYGAHCESEYDECGSNPCNNNASCSDLVGSYLCQCTPGYLGVTCADHVCHVSSPCANGGSCINSGECACAPGYTGATCDTFMCDVTPCENNATCENGVCLCAAGFTGAFCGVDICDYHSCHNGATCDTGECICAAGWSGKHCEFPVNECESDPCDNMGTCYDRVNDYYCQCLPAYTGSNCETHVDDTPILVVDPEPNIQVEIEPEIGASTHRDNGTNGLTIGLICGLFLAILLIIIVVSLVYRRKRNTKLNEAAGQNATANFDNPLYHSGENATETPPEVANGCVMCPKPTTPVATPTVSDGGHVGVYPQAPDDEDPYYHIGPTQINNNAPAVKPPVVPTRNHASIYDTPRSRVDNTIYDNPPVRLPPNSAHAQASPTTPATLNAQARQGEKCPIEYSAYDKDMLQGDEKLALENPYDAPRENAYEVPPSSHNIHPMEKPPPYSLC